MQDKQYVLGLGRVYFDQYADGSKSVSLRGERFLGNAPTLTLNQTSDQLDHFSSTGPTRVLDASASLQTTRGGSVTVDNIDLGNLALFFGGVVTTQSQAAGTAVTETRKLYKGSSLQLGTTAQNPTGVRDIDNLVITTTGGSPVTVAMVTNYEVDLNLGRIDVLDDAATIVDGTEYVLTYDVAAATRDQVISSDTPVYGALRFVSDNSYGKNTDYYIPYAKLTPNGDFSLIGDDWQAIPFTIQTLVKDSQTAAVYIDGRPA